LLLVDILDGRLKAFARTEEELSEERKIFRLCDKVLIEFSKCSYSWEVVFNALKMTQYEDRLASPSEPAGQENQDGVQVRPLSDSQYFQAANIFKNKVKMDIVTLKH